MFTFISHAPVLERTAAENRSAFAGAPQRPEIVRAPRTRLATAALLRRLAVLQLAVAARLERRVIRRPVTA